MEGSGFFSDVLGLGLLIRRIVNNSTDGKIES